VLAMALLVGRRLSRIGSLERSLWVSPLRGLGWEVKVRIAKRSDDNAPTNASMNSFRLGAET